MFARSKNICSFNVAGVKYWDAAMVLDRIKAGKKLKMVAEPDNPADFFAVALYYKGYKVGYIPRTCNEMASNMLAFGHGDAIEAVVQKVNPLADTWEQIFVSLRYKEAKPGKKNKPGKKSK